MISAGYIGGGEDPRVTANVSGQLSSADVNNAVNRLINQDYFQMGANFLTNLGNNIFGYLMQARWATANEEINDRQWDAREIISKDQKEVGLKLLDAQSEADRRMNGPGGLRERLARIQSNRDIEMYDRKLDTQERIAAMRSLDSAFSVRSDYSYGNPYAYS